jgi:3-oxoacyl-[acyl-carrier-protein] synthase II
VSNAVITGLGIVSPIGNGKQAFLGGLRAGRSGLGPLRRLDPERFRIGIGGEVDDETPGPERGAVLALRACREALDDAGIDPPAAPGMALALGSGAGEMIAMEEALGPPEAELPRDYASPLQPPSAVTSKVALELGLRGRLVTFVNACAAGAQAIACASDLVRAGRAEVALAGGVEILSTMVLSGFEALRAVSRDVVRPFDAGRTGIQLSELAAFVVLEDARRASGRGAEPYATIDGSGTSADAYHVTRPEAAGAGAALALRRALGDAGLEADAIDYVNAHGTATPQNDPAEMAAIVDVFGERTRALPVSSTKGMLGHALGASGAAEVVACALAMKHGFLPPTINFAQPIEGYEGFDFVPNEAREGVRLRHVASNAFAFGGHNVVLMLSAPEGGA